MDPNRAAWNNRQHALRTALSNPVKHGEAIELFLTQHAMVHSARMSGTGLWSFEDEIWHGLDDLFIRSIPPKFEHSIAWCIWHLTRCEDITMSLLVAGTSQLLLQDDWLARLCVPASDTGNAMDEREIINCSAKIDIPELRAYRIAVGQRTREIVQALQTRDFKHKTDPVRLQRVLTEGAVLASQQWLIDYWGGLTVAGLLLMPPTRHTMVHLNEAMKIKKKIAQQ